MNSFDLETHLIAPGLLAPPIVCGSWSDGIDSAILYPLEIIDEVEGIMRSGKKLAGANIAYDFGCILAIRPELFPAIWSHYEKGLVFDVQIASTLDAIYRGDLRDDGLYLRDGSREHKGRYSLEVCVKEWLGRSDAKKNDTWRLRYAELDGLPFAKWPKEALDYPIDDAVNTALCAIAIEEEGHNLEDLPIQCHAAFCMHLGAIWGIQTDSSRVEALKEAYGAKVLEAYKYFEPMGLVTQDAKGNWTKKKAPLKAMVTAAYQGCPPLTEKGEISTDKVCLEESGNEILEGFSELSGLEKIADTYVPALELGVLNVQCNPILNTGRASYTGLIQTMPRKGGVRECFYAGDGYVFSSVDYAAVEMVTLAQVLFHIFGENSLQKAINSGEDIHSSFGADMVGVRYESFVAGKNSTFKPTRQAAKAGNFGFPGMMGAAKFVIAQRKAGFHVCQWELPENHCGVERIEFWKGRKLDYPLCLPCVVYAQRIKDAYLTKWPEMKPYWKHVSAQVETNEGRLAQYYSGRIRGGLEAPAAANTLFQGLAADAAKRALIRITKEMYTDKKSALYGSRMTVFAHDETIITVPEAMQDVAPRRQAAIMLEELAKACPDVKGAAEPAIMRYWYKNAEAVYDSEGRLIPWEPTSPASTPASTHSA